MTEPVTQQYTPKKMARTKQVSPRSHVDRPCTNNNIYVDHTEQKVNQKSEYLQSKKDMNAYSTENNHIVYQYIQKRMYLLSALIGDTKSPYNSVKGYVGLFCWIINMCLHFSLDFYEATVVFHVSWASSIGLYLIMFIFCTYFMIRYSVGWYVKLVRKLSEDVIYTKTLKQLKFIFKLLPFVMVVFSFVGATAQYGCYAYDDALQLSFESTVLNSTGVAHSVPHWLEVLINIVRFTSLSHIYYAMSYMLVYNLILFFTLVKTQKVFNAFIGRELKAHPPKMTFQDAVGKFAARTKLLRGASTNSTAVLSILFVATSVSFVVNAYNFLFIKRYAIYVWFAIAPLIWLVLPLIGAALVTSSYHKLKLIVIQSWVEIPEKYDEIWHQQKTIANVVNLPHPNWRAGLENMRKKREQRKLKENKEQWRRKQKENNSHYVDVKDEKTLNIRFPKFWNILGFFIRKLKVQRDEETRGLPKENKENSHLASYKQTDAFSIEDAQEMEHVKYLPALKSDSKQTPAEEKIQINGKKATAETNLSLRKLCSMPSIPQQIKSASPNPFQNKSSFETPHNIENPEKIKPRFQFADAVRLAQRVDKFKSTSHGKSRFNYEKYIKFLELTLDTVGFSIGKVTITFDRVSFFIIILFTLVGVFAQSAFLR